MRIGIMIGIGLFLLVLAGTLLSAAENGTAPKVSNKSTATLEGNVVTSEQIGDKWIAVYSNAILTQADSVFTANMIKQESIKNVHTFTCTGDPVYRVIDSATKAELTKITSTLVVAYSSPRRAEFSGNVIFSNAPKSAPVNGETGSTIEGPTIVNSEKLVFDYKNKQAQFTGTVVMSITPHNTNSSGSDIKKEVTSQPATMTCDHLDYDSNTNKAQAFKGADQVVVKQKDRTVKADKATYDRKMDMIYFEGNVSMENTGEGSLRNVKDADNATISLKTNWVEVKGANGQRARFTFEFDEEQ